MHAAYLWDGVWVKQIKYIFYSIKTLSLTESFSGLIFHHIHVSSMIHKIYCNMKMFYLLWMCGIEKISNNWVLFYVYYLVTFVRKK